MDNLTLDAEALFAIADVIDSYCAKQRETINVYYAQIMALEYEWRDDETFGAITEEIKILKSQVLVILDEIYSIYPKYFRNKAQQILERPIINSGSSETIRGVSEARVPLNSGRTDYGRAYSGQSDRVAFRGRLNTDSGVSNFQPNTASSNVTNSPNIPMGKIPNSFAKTQQVWYQDNPYVKTFNHPKQTGTYLNCNQGLSEKMGGEGVDGFEGTCGLVSCENILRMAGVKITEAEIVNYAKSHRRNFGFHSLCTINSKPEKNGGTCPQDRQKILKHYGIDSKIEYSTDLEKIANYVTAGRGVIASVDACMLWYERGSAVPARHAITITSVERDAFSNEITAFYICDSGSRNNDSSRRIRAELLYEALQPTGGALNITNTIIR